MNNTISVADLREDYRQATLEIEDVAPHPIAQFDEWFKIACSQAVKEPNAMVLATVNPQGRPSARVVLLKGYDESGFTFFTNYQSQKGKELEENPFGALVFNWLELEKQVRIEGKIQKLSPEESTSYFKSRPKSSQIGAWASPQSTVIESRNLLEERVQSLQAQYAQTETLPRPEHWGGYLLSPDRVEFWQGRTSRLHDRIRYHLQSQGDWKIERLAP
ncbi:MAG: pyridoxamine 5'-phosphate oxidase [Saprospiraceae bacterium]|nr:pyridoxamine 5'-phosphate oxidase [Saprospiraceae bacterium]